MATVNINLVKGADWVVVATGDTFLAQNMGIRSVLVTYSASTPATDAPKHGLMPSEAIQRTTAGQPAGNLYAKSIEGSVIAVSE